jgi:hypothetical protein
LQKYYLRRGWTENATCRSWTALRRSSHDSRKLPRRVVCCAWGGASKKKYLKGKESETMLAKL